MHWIWFILSGAIIYILLNKQWLTDVHNINPAGVNKFHSGNKFIQSED